LDCTSQLPSLLPHLWSRRNHCYDGPLDVRPDEKLNGVAPIGRHSLRGRVVTGMLYKNSCTSTDQISGAPSLRPDQPLGTLDPTDAAIPPCTAVGQMSGNQLLGRTLSSPYAIPQHAHALQQLHHFSMSERRRPVRQGDKRRVLGFHGNHTSQAPRRFDSETKVGIAGRFRRHRCGADQTAERAPVCDSPPSPGQGSRAHASGLYLNRPPLAPTGCATIWVCSGKTILGERVTSDTPRTPGNADASSRRPASLPR